MRDLIVLHHSGPELKLAVSGKSSAKTQFSSEQVLGPLGTGPSREHWYDMILFWFLYIHTHCKNSSSSSQYAINNKWTQSKCWLDRLFEHGVLCTSHTENKASVPVYLTSEAANHLVTWTSEHTVYICWNISLYCLYSSFLAYSIFGSKTKPLNLSYLFLSNKLFIIIKKFFLHHNVAHYQQIWRSFANIIRWSCMIYFDVTTLVVWNGNLSNLSLPETFPATSL